MILLDPLPFPEGSLTPLVSEQAVHIHYNMHHAGYVKKLNELLKGSTFEQETKVENIVRNSILDSEIYNQAAQVWNHDFYWNSICPLAKSKVGDLLHNFIERHSGSIETLKAEFEQAANSAYAFGNGWVWLVTSADGRLVWMFMPNAANPLYFLNTSDSIISNKILLACDVWEHAYYLDYQSKRDKYLESYWQMVNWNFAEMNLFGGNKQP